MEEERVVHEQQVGPELDGLVDGVEHGVDGQVDVGDLGSGISDEQAGGVPPFGAGQGPEGFDDGADRFE
ncbi:hypothetical protein GCM10025780_06660 [Frondihabitans cladoniiphilus]|uniref:Uncharacterized protein n=1 Tax=Frondihabitans cladoniiphilus TaxID=715785 RepID=A0ABP8VLV2_9MICO